MFSFSVKLSITIIKFEVIQNKQAQASPDGVDCQWLQAV